MTLSRRKKGNIFREGASLVGFVGAWRERVYIYEVSNAGGSNFVLGGWFKSLFASGDVRCFSAFFPPVSLTRGRGTLNP